MREEDPSPALPPQPGTEAWRRRATRASAAQRWLTALLLSERTPTPLRRWLHAQMRKDQSWTDHYNALRNIERGSDDDGLGVGQLELIEKLVLSEVGQEQPHPAEVTAPRPQLAPKRSQWLPPLAFAGACAALLLTFTPAHNARTDGWRSRGAASDAEPAWGLTVRCLQVGGARVLAEGEVGPRLTTAALQCPRRAWLSFGVTNLSDAPFHLFAVGVTSTGVLRWYAPFEPSSASVLVRPGEVDRILEVVADTSDMPADPSIELFVLFSESELSGADILQALKAGRESGLKLEHLSRLPVNARYQARLSLSARDRP